MSAMEETNRDGAPRWPRRTVLGALGATPLAVGAALAGAAPGASGRAALLTAPAARSDRIPRDARPGGAFDRYVARLAAEDRFSGVVLLAHRGRTVLSRAYGRADRERGIPNREDTAFNLSSASQPFLPVAVLQLAQQGKLALSDTVGTHLTGFAPAIAEQVTIHHLLTMTSGLSAPMPDWRRVFHSRDEVHEHQQRWTRQAELVGVPGAISQGHTPGAGAGLAIATQIVEAASGLTFWDYVHEHVFARAGMQGSGFFTRERWLTDERIAHPYVRQVDGRRVDAVRHLDVGSLNPLAPDRNPARGFIGYASGDGFATAPDLVRFARALADGTLLDRPYADLLTGAKLPAHGPTSFTAYSGPLHLLHGQWVFGRGGATAGAAANWDVYPDTGWVGVVLSNDDGIPFPEILEQQVEAITGQPAEVGGGG